MGDEYQDSQRRRVYEAEFDSWIAGMTPGERAQAEKMGCSEPDTDCQQINGKGRSVEDLTFLSEPEEQETASSLRADCIAAVVSRIRSSGNPLLYMDAMLSALRVSDIECLTCEELAYRHGVSKQRFDIIRNGIIDAFNLPPAPGGSTKEKRNEQAARVKPTKAWVRYTAPLDAWRRWWNNSIKTRPLEEWGREDRRIIANELKWFSDRYEELRGDGK